MGCSRFSLNSHDSFDDKKLFKIGGGILAAVGFSLALFPPLAGIGIAVGLFGTGINLISNFFTSKTEKRRQAVEKISCSRREQVNKQKHSITEKSIQNLENTVEIR